MNEQLIEEFTKSNYEKAMELHCMVIVSREQAAEALCNFAMHLKAMRDGKLYTEIGYATFSDYVENGVNIEIRQVYNYIAVYENLGGDVLQSNAQLGIAKLQLLTTVSDAERSDFIENNDLESMSVSEMKALIRSQKQQFEQLSLLQSNLAQVSEDATQKSKTIDELESENIELQHKLTTLESKPVDVAVEQMTDIDIANLKAEIESELKAKAAEEKAEAIKKAIEKESKAKEKALTAAQKENALAIEKATQDAKSNYISQLEQVDKEKAELLERSKKLEKELALKGDETTVKFLVQFEMMKSVFDKLAGFIGSIEDGEKSAKFATGVKKYLVDVAVLKLGQVTELE